MIFKKAFYASTNVQSERFLETIYNKNFFETWVFELILRDFKEKVLFPFSWKIYKKFREIDFFFISQVFLPGQF